MSNTINIMSRLANLNAVQRSVLSALERSARPLSMRELQEKMAGKRVTILYNLKQLQRRGLVRYDKTRRPHVWVLSLPESAASGDSMSPERLYELISRTDAKRLWGIQGGCVVRDLISKIRKGESFRSIHHRQRLRKVVVDALLTEGGVRALRSSGVPEDELASHLHRPAILHVTPDTSELDSMEVMTDGKALFITDRKTREATVLHDPLAARAYIAMHETIKKLSAKAKPTEVYGGH